MQNTVGFFANLVIPKSEDFNSVPREKLASDLITPSTAPIVVSAAVEFDGQLCAGTIEIEYVWIQRVLSPEFVSCKISVPQISPKNALPSGRVVAQITSAAHKKPILPASWVREKKNCLRFGVFSPSPQSSPRNRGEADFCTLRRARSQVRVVAPIQFEALPIFKVRE
ncbi:MAG: hypothetical protein AUG81_11130 [Verrucomicrobia bacterium 13_1_20CM_4_54_11]|nr:MAG: hypothetical protein AUG81_11130 [Verrucomicrobia bacterium 13_1_20CM_4_54_11]